MSPLDPRLSRRRFLRGGADGALGGFTIEHPIDMPENTAPTKPEILWEEGMEIRVGWHPDNCLVLR